MSAEAIARVVADLRAGRARNLLTAARSPFAGEQVGGHSDLFGVALAAARMDAKVIDATTVYRRLAEQERAVWLYEDHPCIAPPFPRFDVCYRNEHGNVVVMCAVAIDHRDGKDDGTKADTTDTFEKGRGVTQPPRWAPAQPVDWDRVRWTVDTFCWIGGRGGGVVFPTGGPAHLWRFAVYDDGEPADLHWVQLLPDYPRERWDMAHLVLLGAMSFLSCRNVELVEPRRDRAERRRLARTGVSVHELAVFPVGRSTRRQGDKVDGVGVPLTSVRGHFASYGPAYGRGLLFGRYEGRYWISPHARGDRDHGEHRTDYHLEAGAQ